MKRPGSAANVFTDSMDDPSKFIIGDGVITSAAKTWYYVKSRAENSDLPIGDGGIFQSPATGNEQIVFKLGDQLYPIDPRRIFRTEATFNAEQGAIDVTDDSNNGAVASMPDGFTTASGTLNGFFDYDEITRKFSRSTDEVINRFFTIVEDDSDGTYKVTAQNSSPMFMMILLDKDVQVGQYQNWILFQVVISGYSNSFGIRDAQSMDLTWTKGQGQAIVYKRLKTAEVV